MNLNNCTWKNCTEKAKIPCIGKDGNLWANLCDMHNRELNKAIESLQPKNIVQAWIKAKGGAEMAAKSFIGEIFGERLLP